MDNRNRNDELTSERRSKADHKSYGRTSRKLTNHRNKSDEITREKRVKIDKMLVGNRVRNDEMTIQRRKMNDSSLNKNVLNY